MKNIKILYSLFLLTLMLGACKDDFLEEKRDLTGVNEEVFDNPVMAQAYIDYVYGLFLPNSGSGVSFYWNLAVDGDAFTKTTDELAGETNWNKPWAQIAYHQGHALNYFGKRMSDKLENTPWTRLKQINLFLSEVDKYSLSEEVKNPLKGQLYFWRAWQYFDLVRLYGGVPLVLTPQNPSIGDTEANSVPRSSSSETIEQICADLDMAVSLLPGRWDNTNWGRITSGAAAAMKGRVLLTWASPLFNRADDKARWQRAYDANSAAKKLLEENGFGLFKEGGLENAEAWGNMWFKEADNSEAVIVYGFNDITADRIRLNNGWEQANRPKEINGSGSISPTREMVEAFPMKDGREPGSSTYTYDSRKFYKNRDPRFYKTFVYNGAKWPYRENPNYRHWTYKWFRENQVANDPNVYPALNTETRGANNSGIYLRKGTNPNASNVGGSKNNFEESGTDVMEMRFAEVILNLAESAIGINDLGQGKELIKLIRERAGVENKDGDYGLADKIGRDQLFAAVLNERRVEFAYEGKRFWDLRRWMLFESDSPTAQRLGIQDQTLNGKRRTGYVFIVKDRSGQIYKGPNDPMMGSAPVIDRNPATYPEGVSNYDEYVDYLYDNYFEIRVKDDLDNTSATPKWTFTWYNQYYFFGLNRDAMTGSPYLQQTVGWDGINGAGTFDPLK